MTQSKYPDGWDAERVRRVLEHYEAQSDEEAVAEDEAAYEATTHTAMEVPVELVPAVRELVAKRRAGRIASPPPRARDVDGSAEGRARRPGA